MRRGIHLKGRLLKIAELLEKNKTKDCKDDCLNRKYTIADIGCDHGRLSGYLLQNNIADFVIASDISEPSLNKAKLLYEKCELTDRVKIVKADGLAGCDVLPDAIVIAGMGGELIAQILKQGESIAKNASQIIMQSMRGIYELRSFLHDNGYRIVDDVLCKENGRIYQIICACYDGIIHDNKVLPKDFFEIGELTVLNEDALLIEQLSLLYRELFSAISCAKRANVSLLDIEHKFNVIEQLLKERNIDL